MAKKCETCKSLNLKEIPSEVYLIIQQEQANYLMQGKRLSLEQIAIKLIKRNKD